MDRIDRRRRMNGKRAGALVLALLLVCGGVYAVNAAQVSRNAGAMLDAARAADRGGNPAEAVPLYQRYLNFRPKDAEVLAEYTEVLDRQAKADPRMYRDLVDALERLLVVDPTRAADRRRLVNLLLAARYATAAKHHLDYLLDPARGGAAAGAELIELAARADRLAGKPADATARLRQAIDAGGASVAAYTALADALRAEATTEAAEQADAVMDKLLADRPADPAAKVARAKYLFARGKPADARAELKAAVAGATDAGTNPELVLLVADTLLADGDLPGAAALLARGVAASPTDPGLRLLYADVLGRLGKKPEAAEQMTAAASHTKDADPLGLDLIDWMIDRGERAAASTETERRYAGKEAFTPTYQYLTGRLKLLAGDWPAALAALDAARPAFARQPKFLPKLLAGVGDAHLLANNPDKAADAFAEAARLDPSPANELKLADARARTGRVADARKVYEKYADRIPAARLAVARAALADQLAKPPEQRTWTAFEKATGKPPYPAEMEAVRAAALDAQGKAVDANLLLADAVKRFPDSVLLRLEQADRAGRADPTAGVAAVDAAAKAVGDRVPFRLAKAEFLVRAKAPLATVEAVAADADKLMPADRHALYSGLGRLVYTTGDAAAAAGWFAKAAAEQPFDIAARAAHVEALLVAGKAADAEPAVAALAKLEGETGPTVTFARALREIAAGPIDRAKAERLRAAVEPVAAARPTWAKPYYVLGQLAEVAGDPDAAVERYAAASARGERSEPFVRSYVGLLVGRGRFADAVRVLDDREQAGGLSDDLRRLLALARAGTGRADATAAAKLADSKDANDQLFRGRLLLLGGDATAAVAAYEKAVSLVPARPEAWAELVTAKVAANDRPGATAAVERMAAAVATVAGKSLALGRARAAVGDAAGAEKEFQAAAAVPADEPEARRQLAGLYLALGRADDADGQLRAVAAGAAPDAVKRWARRTLAYSLLARPDGFRKLTDAVALIDQNLAAGDRPEDRLAKGIALTTDPFRRADAWKLIDANRGGASPDENAAIALAAEEEGNRVTAEDRLRDATRGPVADPRHLAMLHRVQVARGRSEAAASTLERLKTTAPTAWPTAVAEARLLAVRDKPAAAKRLLAFPAAADAGFRVAQVAPVLVELGCTGEVEALYREVAEKSSLPTKAAPLASYLGRTGKWKPAVELVRSLPDADYPPRLKARLYRDAFYPSPRHRIPEADRPAWDAAADEASAWLTNKGDADPAVPAAAGMIAEARGKYDDAIKQYERSLAVAPDQPDVANNLALLLLLHRGEHARALELANRAIDRAGPKPFLLDTRALALVAAGKPADAVRDLTAASLLAQKPVYDFHLALAYAKANDRGLAVQFREKATKAGLTRESLHPTEWASFDQLLATD